MFPLTDQTNSADETFTFEKHCYPRDCAYMPDRVKRILFTFVAATLFSTNGAVPSFVYVETAKIQLSHTVLNCDRLVRLAEARCTDDSSSRSSKSWRRSWNTEQRVPHGHLVNAFLATTRKRSIALGALAYGLNPIGISSEQKAPATCEKVTVGEIGDPEGWPWSLKDLHWSWLWYLRIRIVIRKIRKI